ncbi:GNAT family N-acetyltransferase [Alkaliphilus serpentinus]|uniref:N-acetyltransferase domain-containing protein n=1 Tax=Alkaliphilus serpentinus TaxID=1482731 RepID=A0A833M985_9FIRM|nr:GNAT family N-acetyltransferase [Alkaliphilus serpentinus]KAB3529221.1 hypothetical protein F8153_09865 [Alkaliphilus serpentinus]
MHKVKNLVAIENLLREDPFANLNVIGRMASNRNVDIYVDNLENPQGFILKDEEFLAPYSRNEEVIKGLLDHIQKDDMIDFCGIPVKMASLVENYLTDYEMNWEEDCHLYYLPEDKVKEFIADETLPSLKEEDVDIVNQHYTYKGEGSREYLLECILNRPSSVIRNDGGEPVSWALVREDYSMGVMYTLKECRKKGLAEKITQDLIYKVIQKGYTPYVHIIWGNTASMGLAEKSGMINWGHIRWFGLKRK